MKKFLIGAMLALIFTSFAQLSYADVDEADGCNNPDPDSVEGCL